MKGNTQLFIIGCGLGGMLSGDISKGMRKWLIGWNNERKY